jgi:hypothetical protein
VLWEATFLTALNSRSWKLQGSFSSIHISENLLTDKRKTAELLVGSLYQFSVQIIAQKIVQWEKYGELDF